MPTGCGRSVIVPAYSHTRLTDNSMQSDPQLNIAHHFNSRIFHAVSFFTEFTPSSYVTLTDNAAACDVMLPH